MLRSILVGAALLWAGPALAAVDIPTRPMLEGHIQPRHEALQTAADSLHAAATGVCDGGGGDLAAVRTAYHATMDAWAGVQHVTYGPIESFNRRFRLQFWPDPRGVLERDLATLLRDQPEDILAPNGLTFASVAIQGLPMVERLTFGAEADALTAGSYRCRLLVAVTANVAAIAKGLDDAWRDPDGAWPGAFRDPVGAELVADAQGLAGVVLTGMTAQLQSLRDQRLLPVMGASAEAAAPDKAEAALSQRSLRGIVASLQSMGEGFRLMLASPLATADAKLGKLMERAFAQTLATAEGIDGPLGEAVKDPVRRGQLETLSTEIKAVQQLLATRVAPALGVSLGFNSLDGD